MNGGGIDESSALNRENVAVLVVGISYGCCDIVFGASSRGTFSMQRLSKFSLMVCCFRTCCCLKSSISSCSSLISLVPISDENFKRFLFNLEGCCFEILFITALKLLISLTIYNCYDCAVYMFIVSKT